MWLPVIQQLEDMLNTPKTKKEKLWAYTIVKDVFSKEVLNDFVEFVVGDEKERLSERDWSSDNPSDRDTKLYLSLSEELQDKLVEKWALDYAFYAISLSMNDFNEEFLDYVDVVEGMAEEFDAFVISTDNAEIKVTVN